MKIDQNEAASIAGSGFVLVGRENAPQNAERSEGRLRSNGVAARKRPLLDAPPIGRGAFIATALSTRH